MNKNEAWEFVLLALCIWREASNQNYEGMLAVGWTVRNRVMTPGTTWWGDTWWQVIEKAWQYTSFEKSDPNASRLPDPSKPTDVSSWALALDAAECAYAGVNTDPTNGATHYYNPSVVTKPPKWADATGTVFKIKIGDHYFYSAK